MITTEKRVRPALALGLAAALLFSALFGCAGVAARENVLMPAMSAAWSVEIGPALLRAGADARVVADVQTLLDSGDVSAVGSISAAVDALRGVYLDSIASDLAAGRIGPNGAAILRETLRQFELNLFKLGE